MFFKDFVSVKRQKIKRGASQTYDTPSFLCMVDTCNRNSSYKEDSSVKSKLPKDLISLFSFCWLIFRLGGTGLGFTEEVEDVGDLHRGEFLAVLAVTGGGELLEKVGDALDPSHQVSTGYCWSSIGKIQES